MALGRGDSRSRLQDTLKGCGDAKILTHYGPLKILLHSRVSGHLPRVELLQIANGAESCTQLVCPVGFITCSMRLTLTLCADSKRWTIKCPTRTNRRASIGCRPFPPIVPSANNARKWPNVEREPPSPLIQSIDKRKKLDGHIG
jgi:hypothetical protein